MLLAFSCHGRYFCPSCHAKRVAAFADCLAAAGPTAQSISVTLGNSLHGSAQDSLDTPYRKACRRTWAQLIEKVYLVSPLVCPRCRSTMNIISFIEDPAVVRKILKHLGICEIEARHPHPRSSWNRHKFCDPLTGQKKEYVHSQPPNAFLPYTGTTSRIDSSTVRPLPFGWWRIPPLYLFIHSIGQNLLLIRACFYCNFLQHLRARENRKNQSPINRVFRERSAILTLSRLLICRLFRRYV